MLPPGSSSSASSRISDNRAEALRHLPPEARAAYSQYEAGGDVAVLDPVILSILNDYIPRPPARPLAEMPGDTRLMEDLGFDSLAITEVVFLTEDIFGIRIANEEIVQVRSLDDLRSFVRQKLSSRPAG